jgi:hypothetical protein
MHNKYKYIYYWLYTWQKRLWGEENVPQFSAVSGMSMSLMANIASFIVILEIVLNKQILPSNIPKTNVLLVGLAVLVFHYFLFMHNGRFIKIENEFKGESKEERKKRGIWVVIYAFGSLAFFIFLLFFGIWFNKTFR